jgi:hypothetical protein
MKLAHVFSLATLVACTVFGTASMAQESSYTPGTVWELSNIEIEPGQFENYMDFLNTTWKKQNEFGKKQGVLVSYHVFSVNDARKGEPDLILAVEYKDYASNAERLAMQKKFEAYMAADTRKMETQSGERKAMRKLAGGMELQELNLK